MFRVGFSKDIHTFKDGNKIYIGGLIFDCKYSVDAYSDGDVLLHSLSEAILGALAVGDLGTFFNNKTHKKGFSSILILEKTKDILTKKNYHICNIDIMIVIDIDIINVSKIKEKIIKNLSNLLKIDNNCISIKATVSELKEKKFEVNSIVLLERDKNG